MKVLLCVEVLRLLVAVVLLSAPKPSESYPENPKPNWSHVKSCIINVTEDLGGGRKRERSYCCEGWRSVVVSSGQLRSCSNYIGDNVTDDSAGLSTLEVWKKVSEEVNETRKRVTELSKDGLLDRIQEEIDKNLKEVRKLEIKLNESEDRVKELGKVLEQTLGNSGVITNPPVDSPCYTATCTNHPEAVCLAVSKCAKDYPVFMDRNTYSLIDDCQTADGQCLPRAPTCDQSLCNGRSCPALTNATCIVDLECCLTMWRTVDGEAVQCPGGGLEGDGRRKRSPDDEMSC